MFPDLDNKDIHSDQNAISLVTDVLPVQLGENNETSLNIGNCSRIPERFPATTQTTSSDVCPLFFKAENKHDNTSGRNVDSSLLQFGHLFSTSSH